MKASRNYLIILLVISGIFSLPMVSKAQATLDKLDKYFEQALTDWSVPGYSIAIVKNGEVVLAKGYGVLEYGKKKKTDEHTLYAIASNTKAFISASIAHLVWEGKIDWDDKVIDHLPYFKLYDDYSTQETTIRDLLCHRVGLGTFSGDVIWYKSNYTAEETVKHARFVPQAYGYRAGYGYTNLMFITAGEVIRAVTGMPWDEFAKQHFFDPLNMDRTVTSTTDLEKLKNVATPHKSINEVVTPIPWTNWDNMGAAGGIISSVSDISKWMLLQMKSGINKEDTLFSPETQNDMWTMHNSRRVSLSSQNNIPSRHFNGYGLGWGLSDYEGRKMVTHGGGYDGMYSKVTMIPEENLGIVVLTNAMTGISTPITMRAIDEFLNIGERDWSAEALPREAKRTEERRSAVETRIEERKVGTSPSVQVSQLVGNYYDPMYGAVAISQEENRLVIDFAPAPELKASLTHWQDNTYRIEWNEVHAWFDFGTVKFVLNSTQEVEGIEFDVPNEDIFFHEIHLKKMN